MREECEAFSISEFHIKMEYGITEYINISCCNTFSFTYKVYNVIYYSI